MLPEYWFLKVNDSHPLWEKFSNWLSEKVGKDNGANHWQYVGYDKTTNWRKGFNVWGYKPRKKTRSVQQITLEEWEQMTEGVHYEIY